MAEKIKPELLGFLQAGELPLRILVVESLYYLPELRQMFPAAEIFAAAAEPDAMEGFEGLDVSFFCVDYRSERLPFAQESLDYIISDLTLEQAGNPQDIAAGFSTFLKQTGSFLTSFRNIRHWSVLKEMMDGHYYHVVSRLFAKTEFERLLYASFYKNVAVRPQRRKAEDDIAERLESAGFDNIHDDLNTEFWLVKADRSMPELALLKSMYTKEQRKALSDYLHRIEYDVDTERQCRLFWAFYRKIGLFPDYTANFITQAVFHPERFCRNLLKHSEQEADEVMELLACMRENAIAPAELLWLNELVQGLWGKKHGED